MIIMRYQLNKKEGKTKVHWYVVRVGLGKGIHYLAENTMVASTFIIQGNVSHMG